MPNAAGGDAAVQSDARNHDHRAIISDLVSLIEHVQATTKLVESAIAGEALPGNQEVATDIVVLDDVTPRYAKAQATLNACSADLGIALHVLLDTRWSAQQSDGCAGAGRLRLA